MQDRSQHRRSVTNSRRRANRTRCTTAEVRADLQLREGPPSHVVQQQRSKLWLVTRRTTPPEQSALRRQRASHARQTTTGGVHCAASESDMLAERFHRRGLHCAARERQMLAKRYHQRGIHCAVSERHKLAKRFHWRGPARFPLRRQRATHLQTRVYTPLSVTYLVL